MGSDAKDLLRTLHPHGEDASVRAHLKPKATSTTGARANPDTVYWLPRSKWVQRKEAAEGGERGVSGDAVAGASTEKVDEEGVMEGGEGDGGIPGVEGSPSKATVSVGA